MEDRNGEKLTKSIQLHVNLLSDPSCGGGAINSNGFFMFRHFWQIDESIVEKCELYH